MGEFQNQRFTFEIAYVGTTHGLGITHDHRTAAIASELVVTTTGSSGLLTIAVPEAGLENGRPALLIAEPSFRLAVAVGKNPSIPANFWTRTTGFVGQGDTAITGIPAGRDAIIYLTPGDKIAWSIMSVV